MPIEFLYLAVIFVVAIIGFSILKRPLYECMLAAFVALVLVTGTWSSVGMFIWDALKEPTLYVIFVFIISAALLSKTTIIDDCIAIILSIFGRLTGGAGFIPFVPFIIALIIGGTTGESLANFLYKQYYPWVIIIGSLSIIVGLIAMYIGKLEGLSVKKINSDDKTQNS